MPSRTFFATLKPVTLPVPLQFHFRNPVRPSTDLLRFQNNSYLMLSALLNPFPSPILALVSLHRVFSNSVHCEQSTSSAGSCSLLIFRSVYNHRRLQLALLLGHSSQQVSHGVSRGGQGKCSQLLTVVWEYLGLALRTFKREAMV